MNYDELTAEDLERMQEVDIRTVNIENLTDLKDINIDTKLPVKENNCSGINMECVLEMRMEKLRQ